MHYKNTIQNSLNFAHWVILQMPLRYDLDLEIHNSHTKKEISHMHEDSPSENFRLKTTSQYVTEAVSNYNSECSSLSAICSVCWI